MMEFADTHPDVTVQPAEYLRLLGYPRGHALEGRARELAEWARGWYGSHGRPLAYARETAVQINGSISLDGVVFASARLLRSISEAGAHSAVLVAVTAGPELEEEAQRLWREGKPDEYFFLEVYGSAVVEHLVTMTGARLCTWADGRQMAVLPHDSPGYPDWPVEEQPRLLDLISSSPDARVALRLRTLDSGMLQPKKSLLAVFGVTRHVERVRRLTDLIPCEGCSFLPCQYRRVPYRRSVAPAAQTSSPVRRCATYTVNTKALRRWADERLSLEHQDDGTIEGCFRYEGTTCTNMGRALAFDYRVTLGPRREGYPIRAQSCGPAPGDIGYMSMCKYISDAQALLTAISCEAPLTGRPIDDVIGWARPHCSTGCYCDAEARTHKWGLVLETIHFALAQKEHE